MTGLTQDTVLVFHLYDPEIMHDVQDDMVRDPSPGGKILPENPCHFGFHVWGIHEVGNVFQQIFDSVSSLHNQCNR